MYCRNLYQYLYYNFVYWFNSELFDSYFRYKEEYNTKLFNFNNKNLLYQWVRNQRF